MTNPSVQEAPRPAALRRRPWLWAMAGCVSLLACAAFVCAVNALYWTLRIVPAYAQAAEGQGTAPDQSALQAELDGLPAGDAGAGQQVFAGEANCQACHSLASGEAGVGPSLAGVGQRAAERRPGYSAELYLYESIAYPGAYAAAGYSAHIMPSGFRNQLTDQELADLIAWLVIQ